MGHFVDTLHPAPWECPVDVGVEMHISSTPHYAPSIWRTTANTLDHASNKNTQSNPSSSTRHSEMKTLTSSQGFEMSYLSRIESGAVLDLGAAGTVTPTLYP